MFPFVLILLITVLAIPAFGQSLAQDALASFPVDTVHLEYSQPQVLRALPDYSDLQQRYVGRRLKDLESSLNQLGIQEDQIDELALGWRRSGGGMDLYGLASGRFGLAGIQQSAQRRGISPESVGGSPAYCVGAGIDTVCVLMFNSSRGAFGRLGTLSEIMDVRHSAKPSLGSNSKFSSLVDQAQKQDPIWGVAEGPGVADWFNGWMSNSGSVQLDWTKVFSNVTSLAYGIQTGSEVELSLKLNCSSDDAAMSLRQVLEGLKLAQQLAWQNQNPNQPNPFQGTDIELDGTEVSLQMAATFGQLGKLQTVGTAAH
jgi:hypothetical protein